MQNEIHISETFKKNAGKAVSTIFFFILVYILLVFSAVLLTTLSAYLGIMLIVLKPMFLTLALGVGMISFGFLILIFLFKFIFKKHIVDRSHLIEIKRNDEPALFSFIEEVVKEVHTKFPKKIYLSPDVNAAVFYDSSFWSMFLPVRKNLQIGIGLVNTVSATEFKSILAHEFGHFSQRSMKVGSYVYNVNQVIYNMLYDNQSYEKMIRSWASLSNYIAIFVQLAVKIIQVIQSILKRMYEMVNLNYMKLSREMEFHADEVAANVTGYIPLKESLLRMELADYSYNTVLSYYNRKIKECIKSRNIYTEQSFVMNFTAKENGFAFKDGLPLVTAEETQKYNKSKLVINNQWASHPTNADRIKALEEKNILKELHDHNPASVIFKNFTATQSKLTEKLFSYVTYQNTTSYSLEHEFAKEFSTNYEENSFEKIYNGYYDNKSPVELELDNLKNSSFDGTLSDFFSSEKCNLLYTCQSIENDKATLTEIEKGNMKTDTFDYDGQKYSSKDATILITKLDVEMNAITDQIRDNDKNIFLYFLKLAKDKQSEDELISKNKDLFAVQNSYNKKIVFLNNINEAISFINESHKFDFIETSMEKVYDCESEFKKQINEILNGELFKFMLTDEIKKNLEDYVLQKRIYFSRPSYNNNALNIMYSAMNNYYYLLTRGLFLKKKELLSFQASLYQ